MDKNLNEPIDRKLELLRAYLKRKGFKNIHTFFKHQENSNKIIFKIEGEYNGKNRPG